MKSNLRFKVKNIIYVVLKGSIKLIHVVLK